MRETSNASGRHTLVVSSLMDGRGNKPSGPVVPVVVVSTTVETDRNEAPEVRRIKDRCLSSSICTVTNGSPPQMNKQYQ